MLAINEKNRSSNTEISKLQVHNVFKDKTILIDAGHGGHDVGAIGAAESYEKDIAFITASELERTLRLLGAKTIVTRKKDDFISLNARTSFSNKSDIDVFLSIHYNSFPEQPDVTGIETYYYHDQHKELAQFIQRGVIQKTNAKNRGISKGDYFVLRENFKPSVLLELGFISNEESEDLLRTNFYQMKIVAGIVSGLKDYFGDKKEREE